MRWRGGGWCGGGGRGEGQACPAYEPAAAAAATAAHMHLFSLSIVCDHGPRSSPRQTFDPFYLPLRFHFPSGIRPRSRCAGGGSEGGDPNEGPGKKEQQKTKQKKTQMETTFAVQMPKKKREKTNTC